MSLVRFNIRNHPQQTAKRGSSDTVDERITPQALYDELDATYKFSVDVAANAANTKCPRFYDITTDGLAQDWADEHVWCNPPYSNIRPWVEKAIGSNALTVMLLPANRTEQKWWQELIEPLRDRGDGLLTTRFLPNRINFGTPDNPTGKYKSSAPFGCVLVAIDRQR